MWSVVWNRTAKMYRRLRQRFFRVRKQARETGKSAKAHARGAVAAGRDAGITAYAGTIRTSRYWMRQRSRTIPRLRRELSVRGELWRAARGDGPVIVGPWLSEVGYEVLYWVPFVRWFAHHYRVDPSRLVVVSRGGVAGWYADVAERYVELLDLFSPAEFAARNAERQREGEQKQHRLSAFDAEIVTRVRHDRALAGATICHPSAMFRLLRQFWLGNESLEYLLEHLVYAPVTPPPVAIPNLPSRFVAMKFYTGKALPDTDANRRALRAIVERTAADDPVVLLNTGLTLDEHQDFLFRDIAATSLTSSMTPQNNLAVQTEVIRRAARFVGTCGSLAWLAPMLGTKTLAVYEDDHLLTPHLYAARHAYASMSAASFTPLDLRSSAMVVRPEARLDV